MSTSEKAANDSIARDATQDLPFYDATSNEIEIFEYAWKNRLPLLIKGPTGCGKTRFVSYMAAKLGLPLYTVACHDDLTAADLVGRHLIGDGATYWSDGPLTRAVREGGICYLDEVVEARKDTTVVLHPLADDRRVLPIDRTGANLFFQLIIECCRGLLGPLTFAILNCQQNCKDRERGNDSQCGNDLSTVLAPQGSGPI